MARGSKQNGSRCDFVSTLRDPQPCFIERERKRERAICISTVHGCNRAAAAGIFLRGRELWRYDIGAYMRADKCVYRVLLLARDISSSPFRTVEPLF